MNVVRYEPWNLLNQLHGEVDRLFTPARRRRDETDVSVATSDWTPAIDIKEEAERFIITADIPGVDPNDVELHMENGILAIKGERKTETQQEREGYKRIERVRGNFYRRFSLPDTANAEAISARSQHGVLEIVIPKHQKVQPRRIQIEN